MSKVYRIKPLEKNSVCWHIEMYRKNIDGSSSWFNIDDHYRWGQGFIEEDMDFTLPTQGDQQANARPDCGWGAELDSRHSCFFEFSDDITKEEQEQIKKSYLYGDDEGLEGSNWLFESTNIWQVENDYIIIDAPFQVDLCEDNGTIIEENVALRKV